MGNRKERLGGSLNWCGRKRRMAMGNRKERFGGHLTGAEESGEWQWGTVGGH